MGAGAARNAGRLVAVSVAIALSPGGWPGLGAGPGLLAVGRAAAAAAETVPSSTDIAHFSRLDDGRIQVQLYNSPVGLPDQTGWRFRDLSLGAPSAGAVGPAHAPFTLRLATAGPATALASLVSEDGVSLQVGLPATAGTRAAGAAARVSGGSVTYAASLGAARAASGSAPAPDLALQPTVSGLSARLVLHGAAQAGPYDLALTPDPRTSLVQQGNAILVTQTLPLYTDRGVQYGTEQEPEYVVQAPMARDSGTSGPAGVAPAGVALVRGPGGAALLRVSVDPAWLRDPARIFPVRVDLPIVTATAAMRSGLFGTLNSCTPGVAAPPTLVQVGQAGGCTYRGQLYFDVSSLWAGLPIQSATLNLYTPERGGPSGVTVFADQPPAGTAPGVYDPLSWQPPSWETAPRPAADAPGIAQSGSDGHWQHWDLTAVVRDWVNRRAATNGGLTLEASGAPVAFASPLGAGDAPPEQAPYLTIVLAPGAFGGPEGIFGLSGIPLDSASAAPRLHPPYTRIGALLGCGSSIPDWSSSYAQAIDSRLSFPLVVFVENYGCGPTPNTATDWPVQVTNYIDGLRAYADSHGGQHWPLLAFEVGNEPDVHSDFANYPAIFAAAAQALNSEVPVQFSGLPFSILTGGVTAPIAKLGACGGVSTYNTISAAIAAASAQVPTGRLGVALHPYSYTTGSATDPNLWVNYRSPLLGHATGNPCFQLDTTINLWASTNPRHNVVLTEINYSSQLAFNNPGSNNDVGAYLVDLFTWMWVKGYAATNSPVCLVWFTTNDFSTGTGIQYLGLYTASGADKSFSIGFYTSKGNGVYCPNNTQLDGQLPILAVAFAQTSAGPCYSG